jgi:hypothetical protein
MCGRYRLSRRKQLVEEHFETVSDEPGWTPRYNIAPTQPVPVIRQNPKEPRRELSLMRWGLIPSWSKNMSGAAMMSFSGEGIHDITGELIRLEVVSREITTCDQGVPEFIRASFDERGADSRNRHSTIPPQPPRPLILSRRATHLVRNWPHLIRFNYA